MSAIVNEGHQKRCPEQRPQLVIHLKTGQDLCIGFTLHMDRGDPERGEWCRIQVLSLQTTHPLRTERRL